jgi:hypothetical protein
MSPPPRRSKPSILESIVRHIESVLHSLDALEEASLIVSRQDELLNEAQETYRTASALVYRLPAMQARKEWAEVRRTTEKLRTALERFPLKSPGAQIPDSSLDVGLRLAMENEALRNENLALKKVILAFKTAQE